MRHPYVRRMPGLAAAMAFGLVAATSSQAFAQAAYIKGPPPVDQVFYRNTSVVRVNPIGLMNDFRFGYRHRLFDNDSPLFRNAYVGAQASLFASPAFVRPGIIAELAPLSILQFSLQYEFLGAFGAFGTLQSYDSAANVEAQKEAMHLGPIPNSTANPNYANTGQQVTFGAMLQMKFPSSMSEPGLVIRNNYRHAWVQQNLENGDKVYYDLVFDLVAPGNGWFLVNDFDLLYMFSPKLTAGFRYTATHAFYNDTHFTQAELESGAALATGQTTHRVGPIVSYAFKVEDGATYNTPTLFVLMNWWTSHSLRTQVVSQAVPMVVVGFSFTGELLGQSGGQPKG